MIQSSGEHLLIVLNDILDFSKFESGKLEIDAGRVDLQAMLEQAIELSFKPKPNLELVYEIAPEVPSYILGDITRLRQICANMIRIQVQQGRTDRHQGRTHERRGSQSAEATTDGPRIAQFQCTTTFFLSSSGGDGGCHGCV